MKKIRILLFGLLLICCMSACTTLGPVHDDPIVIYRTYPSYYYLSKHGHFDKNYHYYRPTPPPRYYRPTPPTPPPKPNNGNRRHR